MHMTLGAIAPDFTANTTQGPIRFHAWIGQSWCLFFSHPKDFTPVCTTELGAVTHLMPEFARRGVKVIGLSVDPLEAHHRWCLDIEELESAPLNYPLIADDDLSVAKLYGMLPVATEGAAAERTAMDNRTARNVFIIGPDKTVRLVITYPMTTGRNFSEILRVIDSLQLTEAYSVATPADWTDGDDVIIASSVSDEVARRTYPNGWAAPKPYLRLVPQPS